MGLTEMSIILFIIISIGQYVVGWAVYAEKRYFAVSHLIIKFILILRKKLTDFCFYL